MNPAIEEGLLRGKLVRRRILKVGGAIGFSITLLAFWTEWQKPTLKWYEFRSVGWVIGMAMTSATIFFLEVVADPEKKRLAEQERESRQRRELERDFRDFFGEELAKNGRFTFVFGARSSSQIQSPYKFSESKVEPEGVSVWLARQDVLVGGYLCEEFARFSEGNLHFETANDQEFSNRSLDSLHDNTHFAIGLGFNAFTEVLRCINGGELFQIIEGPSRIELGDTPFLTDAFTIGFERHAFDPGGDQDIALVARIVHKTINQDDRVRRSVHFVCAGREAPGTTAAGLYLARHWKELIQCYRNDGKRLDSESMVAVVSYPKGNPTKPGLYRCGGVERYVEFASNFPLHNCTLTLGRIIERPPGMTADFMTPRQRLHKSST